MSWPQIIQDLEKSGLSQQEIADHVQSSQSSIGRIRSAQTKEPKHKIGEALISLHKAVCGDGNKGAAA